MAKFFSTPERVQRIADYNEVLRRADAAENRVAELEAALTGLHAALEAIVYQCASDDGLTGEQAYEIAREALNGG